MDVSLKKLLLSPFFLLTPVTLVGVPLVYFLGSFILPDFLRSLIAFILSLYLIYANFMICIKRLHDLSLTGWLSILILAIPLNILFIAYLAIAKGAKGENKYGEPFNTVHPPFLLKISYIFLIGYGIFIFIIGFAFLKGMKMAVNSGPSAISGKAMEGFGKKIKEELNKAPRSIGRILIDNQSAGVGVSIAKDRILVVEPSSHQNITASLSAGKKVEILFPDKSLAKFTRLLVSKDSGSSKMSVFLINPHIGTPGKIGGSNKKILDQMNAFQ